MSVGRAAATPTERLRVMSGAPVQGAGEFVLYWMTAQRRLHSNFALQFAAERAAALRRPLVILEALRLGYRWASDRLHRFVLDGMRDHAAALAGSTVHYYAYVEPHEDAGDGLVEALSLRACEVVTDDYPAFFTRRMLAATAPRLSVRLTAVDGNGLRPMRRGERTFPTAYLFRRALQAELPALLGEFPEPDPLALHDLPRLPAGALDEIARRWPPLEHAASVDLGALAIDHAVPVAPVEGGRVAALARMHGFLATGLGGYGDGRNHPDDDGASGLSPYLHFGHFGAHEVVAAVLERGRWTPERIAPRVNGAKAGWWGLSPGSESYLDELVTWRELGFNFCAQRPEAIDRYEGLPDWARATLDAHAGDPREAVYELDAFAEARTHDPLWNAAQRQLLREGRVHNYLRMLWGKKILEWSATPREALGIMVELNNRYALDGRDPNSTSGIAWVL
ncbi:MAG: deoxyribodipyrimidine photolyase, partial [Dehalococcoidia bacterium]|nr:deoxyribodipyrimidine photolyase [Dehalococcoidia bacterium]